MLQHYRKNRRGLRRLRADFSAVLRPAACTLVLRERRRENALARWSVIKVGYRWIHDASACVRSPAMQAGYKRRRCIYRWSRWPGSATHSFVAESRKLMELEESGNAFVPSYARVLCNALQNEAEISRPAGSCSVDRVIGEKPLRVFHRVAAVTRLNELHQPCFG